MLCGDLVAAVQVKACALSGHNAHGILKVELGWVA